MSYTTDNEIKNAIVAMLKIDLAQLKGYYDGIVSDSRNAAYQEILSRLLPRGYTKVQVDAWDRRVEFERDIALWWILVKTAGLAQFDDRFISKLDRRIELDTVILLVSGELVDPENRRIVGFGYLDDQRSTVYRQVDGGGNLDQNPW